MANQFISQTQQQRMTQVIAPQMRQSLHLLQLPMLELQSVIQEELQTNPTLEDRLLSPDPAENAEQEKPLTPGEAADEAEFDQEFQVLAHLDEEWRDCFQMDHFNMPFSRDDESRREHFMNSISLEESLQESLLRQLALVDDLTSAQVKMAELLIGNIGDDGYFSGDLDELASTAGYDRTSLDELLSIIQEFNPAGVGARNLRECLAIQLDRQGLGESVAALIVREHLDLLAAHKYPDIARALDVPVHAIQEAAELIATLEPRPGRTYSGELAAYVLPEIIVSKVNDDYVVSLANDQLPRLRISKQYRQIMENPDTSSDTKRYIREKIHAGQFLIKSIHQRQQTIRRIATEVVRIQRDFLDNGITHLKPMTMSEVADLLDIHETTVSRAIANKYMQTPRGIYDMKFFFTHAMKTTQGESISNAAIKDSLQQIVAEEDTEHPLSDSDLVDLLAAKGIKVARRTIAKYRDMLGIPPSHLRKSY